MIKQTVYNPFTGITPAERSAIIKFICESNGGNAIDKRSISKALDYAVKDCPSFGGFILLMEDEEKIIGSMIINRTGMEGYSAENVLAFFATDINHRNNGLGRKMMEKAMENVKGDISLHLPPNHPERSSFEALGFQARHVELRLNKLSPQRIRTIKTRISV